MCVGKIRRCIGAIVINYFEACDNTILSNLIYVQFDYHQYFYFDIIYIYIFFVIALMAYSGLD